MSSSPAHTPPHLTRLSVEGYKAFGRLATLELGRLTLILGRNNAGKSALCFAPLFFTRPFRKEAEVPFPASALGVDFGTLQSVCFRRQVTGLTGALSLAGAGEVTGITLGATALPERDHAQFVTRLEIQRVGGRDTVLTNVPWPEARAQLSSEPCLQEVAEGVRVLRGMRPPLPRYHPYPGHIPEWVGAHGELAPMMLAASGDRGLEEVNRWFELMRVRLRIESRRDDFELRAEGPAGEPVNLIDSGAGVAHALPLIVAIRLARLQPSLLCLEQPELHLHPRAHVAIAELLLEYLEHSPNTRLLVETHSDVLLLRVRREIAARRLSPADVRLYFVDEDSTEGSLVREIELDDRGTPGWWPKDVFAEPQKEFFAIRRELAKREGGP
jgi:hypothetical protein